MLKRPLICHSFRSLFGRAFIHSSPAWPENSSFFSGTKQWFKHNCKENVIVWLTSLGNSVQSGLDGKSEISSKI